MQTWLTSAEGGMQPSTARLAVHPHPDVRIVVHPDRPRQTLRGIGGALTQASAFALESLSATRRDEVLQALFHPERSAYSLVRTHVASCDFSTHSYTYAPREDPQLADFSIDVDRTNGHLALLHDAAAVPGAAFDLIASPWTAPPWMKDTRLYFDPAQQRGGRLLEAHHDTFARYLVRYVQEMHAEGLTIWALTPLNEPHGNRGSWESMEMPPEQQAALLQILDERLQQAGLDTRVLIYDQNRPGALDYAIPVLGSATVAPRVLGTAVHWYDSTFRVFESQLEELHARFPDHEIMQTEGCIDNVFGLDDDRGPSAALPWWTDESWYWRKEATDWGWDHEENPERDHPRYAPAFRYARDLVGGLAHWLTGWVDWNVVLDKRGGPNHVGNFCVAPILIDGERDEVYYTPLFHLMEQVSRHTRPGAVVFETEPRPAEGLWVVALRNPGGDRVVHMFNEGSVARRCHVSFDGPEVELVCPPASLRTLVLP